MDSNYKYAAQHKFRFPTSRGLIAVEDLFDLPLSSRTGVDLDTVAKAVNAQLKEATEDSFVARSNNPAKHRLEVSLDIVKDVIATKQQAADAAMVRTQKAAQKQRILEIIESKKNEQLSAASIEELTLKLKELEG